MATDKEGQLKRIDYGDRIFFDSVTGIAGVIYPIGTAAMPSSVIANVITLCAAMNINKINVTGTLTIGAGIAQDLVGHNSILTGQTAGAAYVRGFDGYLEIDAMIGGTLDIYADAAYIQINANCDAPSVINIYGNARVTVVGAPTATINDYTKETQLDDLVTDIEGATGIFHDQADVAFNVNAVLAAEADILHLAAADTRYIVRSLRLKCVDPGVETVTVRLYGLVNDVLTEVDSFAITVANFATYYSLMDMFGLPHLAGDELQVTVQATAAGPYAVTGQYSHGETNV